MTIEQIIRTFAANFEKMKLDILAMGAHPDDVELGAGATLAKQVRLGKKVGIVDLTRGELGTRGTAEIRDAEASAAARVLGLDVRENLGFRDGFFVNDEAHQLAVIRAIRKYRPEVLICNAPHDRHPDHGKGSELVVTSSFLAGLRRIETMDEHGNVQEPWRPKVVYHYIQFYDIKPDVAFVVEEEDVQKKMDSILAYGSQFYDPKSNEPATVISSKQFLDSITNRMSETGRIVGKPYAEAFVTERYPAVDDLMNLI